MSRSLVRVLRAGSAFLLVATAVDRAQAQQCWVDYTSACNVAVRLDTTDGYDDESGRACTSDTYPGDDVTVEIQPPAGQRVIVKADSAFADDLDLIVSEDDCGDSSACVAIDNTTSSSNRIEFTANGSAYYVTVDDYWGAGLYDVFLSVGCPTTCSATDLGPALTCSSDVSGTTAGGTTALDYYECGTPYPALPQTYPERIYTFRPQRSGNVTVQISGASADLDLYVLEGACDPSACIAGSTDLSTNTDSVTFQAVSGSTYYIIAESVQGVSVSFNMSFATGSGGCFEDCDDGIDNDFEGAIDCGDADCASDPVCAVIPGPPDAGSDDAGIDAGAVQDAAADASSSGGAGNASGSGGRTGLDASSSGGTGNAERDAASSGGSGNTEGGQNAASDAASTGGAGNTGASSPGSDAATGPAGGGGESPTTAHDADVMPRGATADAASDAGLEESRAGSDAGCGCHVGPTPKYPGVLLLGAAMLWLRRRRARGAA